MSGMGEEYVRFMRTWPGSDFKVEKTPKKLGWLERIWLSVRYPEICWTHTVEKVYVARGRRMSTQTCLKCKDERDQAQKVKMERLQDKYGVRLV